MLLCFAFVDCAREYQPRKYQPKSTANYKEFDQEDTSKKEENCSNAFVATDEDFENVNENCTLLKVIFTDCSGSENLS